MIQGCEFPANLMALTFHKFDVILGMDWLSKHGVMVDYKRKRISLRTSNGKEVIVMGEKFSALSNVVFVMKALKMMVKGRNAFLAYVLDTRVEGTKIEKIPVVWEFLDVFPKELPGLPLEREVEFGIELIPETTPISITPYKIAPTELKELKTQLQKLLDKGFIRPSVSPWELRICL